MDDKQKRFIYVCIFYFLSYSSMPFIYGYIQTFLTEMGHTVMERSYVISIGAITAIVLQFFVGYLCDRYQSNRKFFILGQAILIAVSWFFYHLTSQPFYQYIFFGAIMGGFYRTVISIQDAWILELDDSYKVNFGSLRAFGSFGWAVGCPIAGVVILHFGYTMLGNIFLIMGIITILLSLRLQDATKSQKDEKIDFKDVKALLSSKKYILTVVINLFAFLAIEADGVVIIEKMLNLGCTEQFIGLRSSLMAMIELPLFFLGGKVIKKFGSYTLMSFALLMLGIRFILYGLSPTVLTFLLSSLLQSVTYPLFMVTSKLLVADVTPKHLSSTGQTIAQSLLAGVAVLFGPLFAGWMISSFGTSNTFYALSVITFFALFLACRSRKEILDDNS